MDTIKPTRLVTVTNTLSSEQEICVVASRDETHMTVYTSDNTWITKLNKLIEKDPESYQIVRTDTTGSTLKVPKKLLSLRTKSTVVISEERKQAMAERMRNSRLNKSKG